MLQRLPIALAQKKAGNTCKNFQNEIHQITYFLCQTKKVIKKSLSQFNEFNKAIIQNRFYIHAFWK